MKGKNFNNVKIKIMQMLENKKITILFIACFLLTITLIGSCKSSKNANCDAYGKIENK